MIFKVGNEIIDTAVTPIALVFKDKEEAINLAAVLSSIKDNGATQYPTEGNGRWWFMTPSDWSDDDKDKWSLLRDDEKVKLEQSRFQPNLPDFQL